eukprot:2575723-Prymnesium_polylepis.2
MKAFISKSIARSINVSPLRVISIAWAASIDGAAFSAPTAQPSIRSASSRSCAKGDSAGERCFLACQV